MHLSHSPNQNRLLAALPTAEFAALEPYLELVPMRLGEMLYEPDRQLLHGYFPINCSISMHYVTEEGACFEIASVGNEGVLGISLFMGGDTTSSSAVTSIAGYAYRLERRRFKQIFDSAPLMRHLLLRYSQALMTQIAQTAVCARHHTIEQHLSRWFLFALDRAPIQELVMTQELIASMIGVRRESITEAAGKLQSAGVISYRRGHIKVVDRRRLEQHACECYRVVNIEMSRLLNDVPCRQPIA